MWKQKEILVKDILVYTAHTSKEQEVKNFDVLADQSLDWLIRDNQRPEEKQKWETLRNNLYLG